MISLFGAFRHRGGPTLYGENKTAVTVDILEAGLVFALIILAVSFLIITPGIRKLQRIFYLTRIPIGLFIGGSILLCNVGQEWEVSEIMTKTAYKSGTGQEIRANIGMKIGLKSINITLKGVPVKQLNETINYNERFHWSYSGLQGRFGFGPQAGRFNQEFRAAQFKGLPYPIIWVAEYFTFDGEGIRWGRYYRTAGFYTYILMWLAFPLWVLSCVLMLMIIRLGAMLLFSTGVVLICANIVFAAYKNPFELKIPFENGVLQMTFGWCFYLNLFTGLLCLVLGLIIRVMDYWKPNTIAEFFNINVLQDFTESYSLVNDADSPGTSGENTHSRGNQEAVSVYRKRGMTRSDKGRKYRDMSADQPPSQPPSQPPGRHYDTARSDLTAEPV